MDEETRMSPEITSSIVTEVVETQKHFVTGKMITIVEIVEIFKIIHFKYSLKSLHPRNGSCSTAVAR